jgi:tripartite-type tricarboxylate transporter receptor subunit TctC
MVLVYKPGSAGVVGSMYVKGAKPDGYTLLLASTSILILPPLTKKAANYHIEDFAPICTLTSAPGVLCVSKSSPYKNLNEFVQAGKTKRMTYSTPGAISGNHLTMEAFVRAAKIEATHVPAAGGAAAQTAVLGGHVDMSCSAPTGMENQLRILSVAQEKRWELHPEVPSLGEQGYSVRSSAIYFSLVAPKGTPKEITDKLYSTHKKVLEENKEAINKIARAANSSAVVLNPDELLKIYLGNNDFYEGTLKKMGVTIKD